jgi:hypothetical protein
MKECKECRADLGEGKGDVCPFCGARTVQESPTKMIGLFFSDNLTQATMIRALLEKRGIPALMTGEFDPYLGIPESQGKGYGIQVSAVLEERAREILCAAGIVCQVEPGEVEGLIRDHVRPAMEKGADGAGDLVDVLRMNKKEVVAGIGEILAKEDLPFLEALITQACESGEERVVRSLIPALGDPSRLLSGTSGKGRAVAAAAAAREVKWRDDAMRVLVDLLEDSDEEVRSEAIEGLFSVTGEDLGYEPDAPPEERQRVVGLWKARV